MRWTRARSSLLPIGLAISLGACAPDAPAAGSGGDPTVACPVATITWELGCAECADRVLFDAELRAVVKSGESIAVLASREPYLRLFGEGGVPIGSFGANGEGPGELQEPIWALPVDEGKWVVQDLLGAQLVQFTSAGAWLGSTKVPFRLYLRSSGAGPKGEWFSASTAPGVEKGLQLERWSTNIAADGTVSGEPVLKIQDVRAPELSVAATLDGGFILGRRSDYDIREYDRNGREIGERQPGPGLDEEGPYFDANALQVDGLGWLWVLRSLADDDSGSVDERASSRFDLFSPAGRPACSLRLDRRVRGYSWRWAPAYFVTDTSLAALVTDEDGNESLAMWSLER